MKSSLKRAVILLPAFNQTIVELRLHLKGVTVSRIKPNVPAQRNVR